MDNKLPKARGATRADGVSCAVCVPLVNGVGECVGAAFACAARSLEFRNDLWDFSSGDAKRDPQKVNKCKQQLENPFLHDVFNAISLNIFYGTG